jgi:hypothetical protein
MQTYGHYEFEILLKDEENLACFDCGKTPAQWASVNNAIYLCLSCAGEHRGLGVAVSYVRSITIDTWNDNQINMMKNGGNKALRELLDVYQIDRFKIDKQLLYNSRLLDFYRKLLKSKVNRESLDKVPPGKDEALKGLNVEVGINQISDSNKYASVTNKGTKQNTNLDKDKFKSVSSDQEEIDTGFINSLNNYIGKSFDVGKFIVNKVGDIDIQGRIINTGWAIGETGSSIVNKGTEAAVRYCF